MCSDVCYIYVVVFFFKHDTAYDMRISDWSSDVCSSDLLRRRTSSRRDDGLLNRDRCATNRLLFYVPLSKLLRAQALSAAALCAASLAGAFFAGDRKSVV